MTIKQSMKDQAKEDHRPHQKKKKKKKTIDHFANQTNIKERIIFIKKIDTNFFSDTLIIAKGQRVNIFSGQLISPI